MNKIKALTKKELALLSKRMVCVDHANDTYFVSEPCCAFLTKKQYAELDDMTEKGRRLDIETYYNLEHLAMKVLAHWHELPESFRENCDLRKHADDILQEAKPCKK
jgi:hypothetical protein